MELAIENKKRAIVFLVLIVIGIGFMITGILNHFNHRNVKKTIPDPLPTNIAQQDTNHYIASAPVSHLDQQTILQQNPFVDMAAVEKNRAVPNTENVGLSSIPTAGAPPVGSIPLPVIPNMERPASMPAPTASSVPQLSSSHAAAIQGILTGQSGNNMAIMADGRVVSEGDTYNNDHIAYIGGNGITFDDGHTLEYSDTLKMNGVKTGGK